MEKRFQSSILCLKNETRTQETVVKVEENFNPDKRRKQLLNKIEDIILHTVQSISSETDEPTLVLRPVKTQWKNCNFDNRGTKMARRIEVLQRAYESSLSGEDLESYRAALATKRAPLSAGLASNQGFDPVITLRTFWERANMADYTDGDYVIDYESPAGVASTWRLPKRRNFATDLKFFVGLYCLRGTDCGKIASRSSDAMKAVIQAKCAQYGISCETDNRRRQRQGRQCPLLQNTITLGRLAACVPHLVCDYYSHNVGRDLLTLQPDMQGFPPSLRHSQLASVWPRGNKHFDKSVVYMVARLIDEKVNPGRQLSLTTLVRFQDIALGQYFHTEEYRVGMMKDLGVMTAEGTVAAAYRPSFDALSRMWNELFQRHGQASGRAESSAGALGGEALLNLPNAAPAQVEENE